MQGYVIDQRLIGDDHTGSMCAGIAHHTFHIGSRVDQIVQVLLRFVHLFELGDIDQGFFEGDRFTRDVGDELGNPVDFAERDVHHPAYIADGSACAQCAEGDDLSYPVGAKFTGSILEHLGAAVITKIQVDIRHGNTPGVEEALEDQPVMDGLDQGDIQAVGDDRTVAGAAGVVPDALLAGIAAQVPHDEEIGVEAHLVDDLELVIQALAHLWIVRLVTIAASQAGFAQLAQIRVGGEAGRHLELGQVVALETQVEVTALGDEQGVGKGIGGLYKQLSHFLRAAQVEAISAHAHAPGIGEDGTSLDGEHDILQTGVLFIDVMHIVGGNEAGVVAFPQLEQLPVHRIQLGDGVVLKLEEVVVGSEQVVIPAQHLISLLELPMLQEARDLGRHAAGGADQPFSVLGQDVMVDARVVVEALQLGDAGKLEQVLVARGILRQQQQVSGLLVFLGVVLLDGAGCQVSFQPDDGLDTHSLGGVVELDDPKHGAVVGDGDGWHIHLVGALDQLVDVAESIQQGVFSVDVKMDK